MNGNLVNLNELLIGDKLFDIPVYQRSYAWEERNLKDLWEDIYYLDATKKHYFGTVLLKDSGEIAGARLGLKAFKKFDVIDGQQRLTTALILLREIFSQMKTVNGSVDYQEQVADLEEDYLKSSRHGGHYKLNPLGEDGKFFHDFIVDNNEHLDPQTRSQRQLVEAKSFFRNQLNKEKKREPSNFESFLVEFKNKIDGLQLMQYIVNSNADAICIFETANDRGRLLSDLEKTKSFLMHTSYLGMNADDGAVEGKLQELNGRFSRIYSYSENVDGNKYIRQFRDDIQRYHFINYRSLSSGDYMDSLKDLMRDKLRQDKVNCVEYALDYAKDLEQAFFAVKDIAAKYEKGDDELGRLLGKIFMMERLANVFPLLIASWLRFHEEFGRMAELLRLFEVFLFRVYVIGRHRSDTGRGLLYDMAHKVHRRQLNYDDLIEELKNIDYYNYRDDREFEIDLRSDNFYYNIRSSRDKKYLLSEYEIHLREKSGDLSLTREMQEKILSLQSWQVEHIWPVTPADELSENMADEHEQNVHKLGNLTITSWNASLGNKPFGKKRDGDQSSDIKVPAYVESDLRIQRDLKDFCKWDQKTIRQREDEIVEFALQRWSV